MTRRDFIEKSSGLAGLTIASTAFGNKVGWLEQKKFTISIFSKNLQWLDYDGMAATAAELGFDGVDLTVRPNGHVLPEKVEEDLPKAAEAVKRAGLKIFSIVTSIDNAADPTTTKILRTAASLGIPLYRLGWFHYRPEIPIAKNIEAVAEKLRALDELGSTYKIQGVFQNHSGEYFGAPIWDFAQALKQINSKSIGIQYDIYHAMIEGANSWIYGFDLIKPYIWMINVKDYQWAKKEKWQSETVPLGSGMVDWKRYFSMLKQNNIICPVSLHYEYPIGGAEHGGTTLKAEKSQVLATMKKDLEFLKNIIAQS
jgi:L-ribulose-5-phosphate 3-epimerase